jgi:hypothetical protein
VIANFALEDFGGGLRSTPHLLTSKGPPSSVVQLRIAVWTGVTRDKRPEPAIQGSVPPPPTWMFLAAMDDGGHLSDGRCA